MIAEKEASAEMRALVQRVRKARVDETKTGKTLSEIGPGLLVFIAVTHEDTEEDANWIAGKIARLRIFEDEAGKMNRSVQEIGGSVLVVSQFTLYGDVSLGNRPSFIQAAKPDVAEFLYDAFIARLRQMDLPVQTGRFAADMQVMLINDGPVTILIESPGGEKNG